MLAVAIVMQSVKRRIGQPFGRRSGGKCDLTQEYAGIVKDADDHAAAVVATPEERRCNLQETLGQRQRLGRISRCNLLLDRAKLAFQTVD